LGGGGETIPFFCSFRQLLRSRSHMLIKRTSSPPERYTSCFNTGSICIHYTTLRCIILHKPPLHSTPLHSTPLQQRNHTLLCPGSISCITLPISSIPSLHHHGSRRTPSFKIQDDYNDAALCVCFVYRSLDLLS
jgi:hypothetical protein